MTVDLRCPSRALATDQDNPGAQTIRIDGQPLIWRQGSWHGAPCFPGSYQDVSRRTADLRTPDWRQGHAHPRRILLYVPPPPDSSPRPAQRCLERRSRRRIPRRDRGLRARARRTAASREKLRDQGFRPGAGLGPGRSRRRRRRRRSGASKASPSSAPCRPAVPGSSSTARPPTRWSSPAARPA